MNGSAALAADPFSVPAIAFKQFLPARNEPFSEIDLAFITELRK